MNDAISYKTIFVLDCSDSFRSVRCGKEYEIDVLNKNRQQSQMVPPPHLPPLSKSLYTCAVEATFEYCRIVWDLFPDGERLIRISCCVNDVVRPINSWECAKQNYQSLSDAFQQFTINFQPNRPAAESSVPNNSIAPLICGFYEALQSVSSSSSSSGSFSERNNLTNSARIIFITHFTQQSFVDEFRKEITNLFEAHNRLVAEKQKSSSVDGKFDLINHLDVILLNSMPFTDSSSSSSEAKIVGQIPDTPKCQLSDHLTLTMLSVHSGAALSSKLAFLTFDHYDLATTTVSGIPMKEEQNAGTSANYDVEIVHSKRAHTQFLAATDISEADIRHCVSVSHRDGHEFRTLVLRWCTPKSNSFASDCSHCSGAYRITALDVNSRPSTCLINFLHTGKTVNLEAHLRANQTTTTNGSSKASNKVVSHMLQCHAGELFIHVVSWTRSTVEDPPAISEGVGGRVTDYRINEFADFMRRHHLTKIGASISSASTTTTTTPASNSGAIEDTGSGLARARLSLNRGTAYWPVAYGLSVFFNVRDQIQTFHQLIGKERLTGNEEIELKNIIYSVTSNETKGVNLPIQSNLCRGKSAMKRDDLYRILWTEMEHIVRCYADQSLAHQSVLQCLLDCKPKYESNSNSNIIINNNGSIVPLSGAANSVIIMSSDTDLVDNRIATEPTSNNEKIDLTNLTLSTGGGESLLSLYVDKVAAKNAKRRREFYGRLNANGNFEAKVAKLYAELAGDDK